MKKFMVMLLIFLFLINGCAKGTVKQEQLSEIQITACNSADKGGTCDTKLASLNIVTKEQCCQALGKCCK